MFQSAKGLKRPKARTARILHSSLSHPVPFNEIPNRIFHTVTHAGHDGIYCSAGVMEELSEARANVAFTSNTQT